MKRFFSPFSMILIGLFILSSSITLYIHERYTVQYYTPGVRFDIAGEYFDTVCRFSLLIPKIDCMSDQAWEEYDITQEIKAIELLIKELDQQNRDIENQIWQQMIDHGLVWSA